MSDQAQPAEGGVSNVAYEPTGCDGWIPGVPKTVPRRQVLDLIKALGIDPANVYSLRFEPHTVYAEVYALKDGGRYWDGGPDDQPAMHRFAIAIEDRAPEPAPEASAQFASGGLISDTCRTGVEELPAYGITVNPAADPADVGRQVVEAIKEYEGRGEGPA